LHYYRIQNRRSQRTQRSDDFCPGLSDGKLDIRLDDARWTTSDPATGGFINVAAFVVKIVPEPAANSLLALGELLNLRRRRSSPCCCP